MFVLLCASLWFSAEAQGLLGINKTDGSEKQIAISLLSKLTFSNSNMIVSSINGSTEEIPLTSIRKMVFNSSNGIAPVAAASRTITLYPVPARKSVFLKNAPEGDLIAEIYNVTGSLVSTQKISSASQQVDVGQLPAGLYLMKVNHQTIKFTKQ